MTNNKRRHDSSHYQTPDSIRNETFRRRLMGLDPDEVYDYLDVLADQLQAAERELAKRRAESEALETELQRADAKVQQLQTELDEYEQVGERVNEQVVQLFSQAQLVAEEMLQDVSRDARERIGQARDSERQIVEKAMDSAGQHVREYARTAQEQMQSIVNSFAAEIDRIADAQLPGDSNPTPSHRNGASMLNELEDWQISFRNGSGPHTSSSD